VLTSHMGRTPSDVRAREPGNEPPIAAPDDRRYPQVRNLQSRQNAVAAGARLITCSHMSHRRTMSASPQAALPPRMASAADIPTGLTASEAASRLKTEGGNVVPDTGGRSWWDIVHRNLFTCI